MGDPTAGLLRQFVERLRRLYEERKGINDDIRDVFCEAKAMGFDGKTLRAAIRRQEMRPDDRAEADALLALYEEALAGNHPDDEPIPDARPDVAALALSLLSAQIVGLEDPEHAALLVEHVTWLLDLRAEIAEMRVQERERKAVAEADGFDKNQISVTVRWFEKCAKHGPEMMRAGEAVFHRYRGAVDAHNAAEAASGEPVSGDPKLAAMFAAKPPPKPSRRTKSATDAAALARAARQAGE